MTRRTIGLMSLVSVLLVGMIVGCESNNLFTRQRYETIYTGQESYEVEATLGPPYQKFSRSWTYINRNPFYKAVIGFDEERQVTTKAWYDEEEMGDHPEGLDAGGSVIIDVRESTNVRIED